MNMRTFLTQLIKSPVVSMEKIGKGANSKVYRIVCKDGSVYASKFYFQCTVDGLDRMSVEFPALKFLWANGVRVIPKPIVFDVKNKVAVYEFIDGQDIPSEKVSEEDINRAAEFLYALKKLTAVRESKRFSPASEACFSIKALIENIQVRLARLEALHAEGTTCKAMHRFLSEDFIPVLENFIERAKLKMTNSDFFSELPNNKRTLSPSDYGFHNALRRRNGEIVFVDFEYFGWDDPAKIISDFLLHPAMDLSDMLKHQFVEKILGLFGMDVNLRKRLEVVYPFFGLKWCMILLNEFTPESLQRRMFATGFQHDVNDIQVKQLTKAESMLRKILTKYENFSYRI